MISDEKVLREIRESWCTVRILEARIAATCTDGLIFSLLPAATNFREIPESLLLLWAISVLESSLEQLRDERVFVFKGRGLKDLLRASQKALPWQDFAKIDRARERRDAIAHHRAFLSGGECAAYLNAIENELLAWGILEHRIKGRFGISMGTAANKPTKV